MDLETILKIVGMAGTLAVQTWLLVKYLIDRQDKAIADERKERLEMIEKLDDKISTLNQGAVKREEFTSHVESMKADSQNLMTLLTNMGAAINSRLDGVLLMLAKGNQDNGAKR